jgi:hypothetical protein
MMDAWRARRRLYLALPLAGLCLTVVGEDVKEKRKLQRGNSHHELRGQFESSVPCAHKEAEAKLDFIRALASKLAPRPRAAPIPWLWGTRVPASATGVARS